MIFRLMAVSVGGYLLDDAFYLGTSVRKLSQYVNDAVHYDGIRGFL